MNLFFSLFLLALPGVALAGEAGGATSDVQGVGLIAGVLLLLLLLSMISSARDWLEAKAGQASELARKLKLDNDRIELENKARASDLGLDVD